MNNNPNRFKILILLITACIFLSACSTSQDAQIQVDSEAIEAACTEAGGTFVEDFIECEYISEETCTEMGGEFNECASACRHEEEDVICTAQCVPVCSFVDEG